MNISVRTATDAASWDRFLIAQPHCSFLQSWTMGTVYAAIGQEPVRLAVYDAETMIGACFAHVVPARRGRHLSIPYGPILAANNATDMQHIVERLFESLVIWAGKHNCSFIRFSPLWPQNDPLTSSLVEHWLAGEKLANHRVRQSPLHLLAENLWILPLAGRTAEELRAGMRKTTRNLVGRAQRDGVEIIQSDHPDVDLRHFIALHDETRQRHKFTPYTNNFFAAQVRHFSAMNQCSLYLARYEGEIIAASIHMHFGGETSYHHGASSYRYSKVPASYLLQWRAIEDARDRGDHTYNFWGVAPTENTRTDEKESERTEHRFRKDHPFAGVTTFKTGFGGKLLPIVHCMDLPLTPWYAAARIVELLRKWHRGF